MSRKAIFIFAILFFCFPIAASIAGPSKELIPGETLVFDVFWMGIPVGTGVLKVEKGEAVDGHPTYKVTATAQTNDFLTKIYPVHDEIHSRIDAAHWRSLEFGKSLKEGRYRAEEKVIYDYSRQKGFYESALNKGHKEFAVPTDAQDFLSAFFWFRVQDVGIGKSVHTVINDEGKSWDLEVAVLSRQTKELRGGRVIETVMVEPKTRYNGVLYDRGRAWVWFGTDAGRTPVWIRISTPFGPVVGVLRDPNEKTGTQN